MLPLTEGVKQETSVAAAGLADGLGLEKVEHPSESACEIDSYQYS
jgi:hypothetical protein